MSALGIAAALAVLAVPAVRYLPRATPTPSLEVDHAVTDMPFVGYCMIDLEGRGSALVGDVARHPGLQDRAVAADHTERVALVLDGPQPLERLRVKAWAGRRDRGSGTSGGRSRTAPWPSPPRRGARAAAGPARAPWGCRARTAGRAPRRCRQHRDSRPAAPARRRGDEAGRWSASTAPRDPPRLESAVHRLVAESPRAYRVNAPPPASGPAVPGGMWPTIAHLHRTHQCPSSRRRDRAHRHEQSYGLGVGAPM